MERNHHSYRNKGKKLFPDDGKVIRRRKSDIKKSESLMTIHHRRPISLGGLDRPWNISYITHEIHKAWTIVAGNMNAEQICNYINTNYKPKGVTLICMFINGHPCKQTGFCGSNDIKISSYGWRILFKGFTRFQDKIAFINNVLLDPSYRFYIRE